jgi:hypothetical protein
MSEAPDLFADFESAGEIAAFIYRKFGADGLRECLGITTEGSTTVLTSEFLECAADELAEVGLSKAADIVADVSADSPSALDLCPYDPDSHNGKSWLARRARRMRRKP